MLSMVQSPLVLVPNPLLDVVVTGGGGGRPYVRWHVPCNLKEGEREREKKERERVMGGGDRNRALWVSGLIIVSVSRASVTVGVSGEVKIKQKHHLNPR